MADQQIPPEMLAMLAQTQGQNGGSPQPDPAIVPEDPHKVSEALLRACRVAAENSATAQDTREMAEAAKAALAFAQAIVVLDPNLTASGEPLDHQLAMEGLRGQNAVAIEQTRGANALEQAKAAAAAPTPAKSISVKRDGAGRATNYDVQGG